MQLAFESKLIFDFVPFSFEIKLNCNSRFNNASSKRRRKRHTYRHYTICKNLIKLIHVCDFDRLIAILWTEQILRFSRTHVYEVFN